MYSQDRTASDDGRSSRRIYKNKNVKSSLPRDNIELNSTELKKFPLN